jgi:hypothetical protein
MQARSSGLSDVMSSVLQYSASKISLKIRVPIDSEIRSFRLGTVGIAVLKEMRMITVRRFVSSIAICGLTTFLSSSAFATIVTNWADCGAGVCQVTVADPSPITTVGGASQQDTDLINDMKAQFPGWQVTFNPTLIPAKINTPNASAIYNPNSTNGQNVGQNFFASAAAVMTGGDWVQTVQSNYSNTGGPGVSENRVDVDVGAATPYYMQVSPALFAPGTFDDHPGRLFPTAANPTINWTGNLFLVSADTGAKTINVVAGKTWMWTAQYRASPPPSSVANNVTVWTLSNVEMKGFWGEATATGFFETGACGSSCLSNITVIEGAYSYSFTGPMGGLGWTVPSQQPPPSCVLGGCSGTLYAALSLLSPFTGLDSAAFFSLSDAGEIFPSFSGEITGTLGTGPAFGTGDQEGNGDGFGGPGDVISATPIPPALPLFGAGLLGMLFLVRSQKRRALTSTA